MRFRHIILTLVLVIFTVGCGDDAPDLLDGNGGLDPNAIPGGNPLDGVPQGQPKSTNSPTPTNTTAGTPTQTECGEMTCGGGQSCVGGLCVDDGALRISLVWDNPIDLDLHVRTPSGEELYYRNREGVNGGRFVKDGCLTDRCDAENGPFIETVMWPGADAPNGQYEIWGVNYDGGESVDFRIEVIQNGTVKATFDANVANQAGARSMTHVVCIGDTAVQDDCSMAEVNEDLTACLQELDRRGVTWEPWGYSTQSAGGAQCTVADPIRVLGSINGVEYRYYNASSASPMSMACPLALKLYDFGNVLKPKGITSALHIGTFNCRNIAGTSRLSQHAHGNAIDLWGFVGSDGTRYILEEDWEHNTTRPSGAKAKTLYDIAQEAHAQRIFNTILTPNYNSAHDNHFHVDLKEGANYLGYQVPESYLGDDEEHWGENCPN